MAFTIDVITSLIYEAGSQRMKGHMRVTNSLQQMRSAVRAVDVMSTGDMNRIVTVLKRLVTARTRITGASALSSFEFQVGGLIRGSFSSLNFFYFLTLNFHVTLSAMTNQTSFQTRSPGALMLCLTRWQTMTT